MSRADQSLSAVTPNTWSAKADAGTGVPCERRGAHHEARAPPRCRAVGSVRRSGRPVRALAAARAGGARRCRTPRPCRPGRGSRSGRCFQLGVSALAVGAEDPAHVGGVLLGAVEVDVVGDLERQVQASPPSSGTRLRRPRTRSVSCSRTSRHAVGPSARNAFSVGPAELRSAGQRARRRRTGRRTARRPAAVRRRRSRRRTAGGRARSRRSQHQPQLDEVLVGLEDAARAERREPPAGPRCLVGMAGEALGQRRCRRSRRARAATSSGLPPSRQARVASRTLRKPWCSKPVSRRGVARRCAARPCT